MITFDNSYAELGPGFTTLEVANPFPLPEIFHLNKLLAADLNLDISDLNADFLSGQTKAPGSAFSAMAYAGHQFGHWSAQLGDGRALLLGEVVTPHGRFDLQLKGAGRTAWSRGGDGKAWLGPVLREYVVSEAMQALGVPTTRALAAVTTGETVARETALPGAVLTRVAPSHIRVGTFQYFASRDETDKLAALAEHTRARHYPKASSPLEMLRAAVKAQAKLVAKWMGIGFIHGVMNTDNAHAAGITIDYGPCAFMDVYNPGQVFSSIDHSGRYAYANQPQIAAWNMAQFATALLPLEADRDVAIPDYQAAVDGFAEHYQAAWADVFAAKLGLHDPTPEDVDLAKDLLGLMARSGADFTNTFRSLSDTGDAGFKAVDWLSKWHARAPDARLMSQNNPAVIPRNHQIEAMITDAVAGDRNLFDELNLALATPFKAPDNVALCAPPRPDQIVSQTFCGT